MERVVCDTLIALSADWFWSMPLMLLTVMIHCFALFGIREGLVAAVRRYRSGKFTPALIFIVGAVVLYAMVLLAFEGTIWAVAYVAAGASPDMKSAELYSLEALTSYGHADVFLRHDWQLMGALEALNGAILLGLTTAFLFAVVRSILTDI